MKEFLYKVNLNGVTVERREWAETKETLAKRLQLQGLIILSIELVKGTHKFNNCWTDKEIISFSYQMELLFNAGLPLRRIMELLIKKTSKIPYGSIKASIERGQSLAQVLEEHGLSALAVAIITAGEASGTLGTSFSLIKQFYEKRLLYRKKIVRTMIYPAFLLVLMIVFFLVTMFVILPNFRQVFITMHVELPWMTKLLFALSDILKEHYMIIMFSFCICCLGVTFLYRQKYIKYRVHKYIWNRGISLDWLAGIQYMSLLQIWSILLDSGISIIDSVKITQGLWLNCYGKVQSDALIEDLKSGHSFQSSLKDNHIGTPFIWDIVIVGEESGELVTMLAHCANYYETILDSYIKTLERLLEPILLSIMGLGIGILVATIMVPIFNSVSALGH